jgi:DNA-binding transcriptional LysR family regulator
VDNLNDISVFIRVVDRRSFIAAARDLQISASAVSKQVSRLEESLGVQLLKRSTRRLTLTDSGSDFYARCAKAMSELEHARDSAVRRSQSLTGTLRVQTTVSLAQRLIVPAIREFIRVYPGIAVNLTIGPLPANLIEHSLDVVFVQWIRGKDASLEYRTLAQVRYFVCAAPSYLRTVGRPARPQDLVRFNCLIHEPQRGASEWRFADAEGDCRVKVRGNFQTNNGVALHEAVVGGLGIARLPDFVAFDDIRAGRLEVLFDTALSGGRTITAAYPRRNNPPARLHAFLEFVAEFVGQERRISPELKKVAI